MLPCFQRAEAQSKHPSVRQRALVSMTDSWKQLSYTHYLIPEQIHHALSSTQIPQQFYLLQR